VWDVTSALLVNNSNSSSDSGGQQEAMQEEQQGKHAAAAELQLLPASFDLTYKAYSYLVGGDVPSEQGCGGHIIMTSRVTFY